METKYFASELRYLGKGTIESTNTDGTLTVNIEGMGRGRVASDQVFGRKRDALAFSRPPHRGEWSDVAQISRSLA